MKRWTHLPPDFLKRASVIYPIISKFFTVTKAEWIDGFLHDTNPDHEIAIWEYLAYRLKKAKSLRGRKQIYMNFLIRQTVMKMQGNGEQN